MTETWLNLVNTLTKMTNPLEMEKFLREILTEKEISDLTLRWQLLRELHAGEPQRKIAAKHGISLCKITRGSRILKADDSICAKILQKNLKPLRAKGKNDD